jgi:acetate kinase
MTESDAKVIDSFDEITAIGHRVVQGGDIYDKSVLITDEVLKNVDELSELAPLHNPANLLAIKACTKLFGDKIPQVAVFDTSFHQTMEATQYIYPIPYEYYEKYKVRRYGAHGTSHRYVSDTLYEITDIKRENSKVITCHLGNGCSITAIKDGKCFDTSMGFTPLDGFMMGTRSGQMDPSVLTYIANKENLSPDDISNLLNKKSGVLGVSGVSNDSRDVDAAANNGNYRAQLSNNMQRYDTVIV